MTEPLAIRIMQTVTRNKSVFVDFLVHELGSSRAEVDRRIDSLVNSGVVRRVDDRVELARESHSSTVPPAIASAT